MADLLALSDAAAVHAAIAARTHPGQRRQENQDNFLVSDLSEQDAAVLLRPLADEHMVASTATVPVGPGGALLLVADGMGGAAAGRLASGLACSFILAELLERGGRGRPRAGNAFGDDLRDAVAKANRSIHDHALRHPEYTGMGTTVTAVSLLAGSAYLAQVGDSRAYLVRGDVATQLTRDQSVVQQLVEAGAMTLEEAERSAHGNLILQAVGVEPEVSVELTSLALCRDDLLVVCSDGLHRMVSPAEIAEVTARAAAPAAACEELVGLANGRGGPDNITVIVARLSGDVLPPPRPAGPPDADADADGASS
jgi:PPM family protein phosphatase